MAKTKNVTTDESVAKEVNEDFKTEGTTQREQAATERKNGRPDGEVLISGAEFWDFEESPIFIGKYMDKVIREKDGPNAATNPNEKAGSVMGFKFEDEFGQEHIIGNSNSIQKALEKIGYNKNVILYIEFEGKTTLASGKPFNRFHIQTVKSFS